jgi:hypothetical protein
VTSNPGIGYAVAESVRDEARFVTGQGDWYLFESRLPLVPIDSPDEHVPTPHPPSLARRLKEFSKRAGTELKLDPPDPQVLAPSDDR